MLGFDACVELVAVRSVSLLTHRTRRSSRGKTPSFAFLLKKIQFPKDVRKNNSCSYRAAIPSRNWFTVLTDRQADFTWGWSSLCRSPLDSGFAPEQNGGPG
ncbi:Hypothetical protein SMAX5B_007752 [Scophthalmus maximus]|uniref:Uncharacterized protein n=1 Tax=Scophthalmus maximus TaxID=52904 RepID=A0A2U9B2F4_SCOMX|nr:Hypothetical protein SMAX5B_007752 [Scophthalmus maximus]